MRNSAIIAVLGQYERVLVSLEEMAKSVSRTASDLCWVLHLLLLLLENLSA